MFIADTPTALARAERTLPARGALRPVKCPARREHKQPHASHRARRQKKSTTVRARTAGAGGWRRAAAASGGQLLYWTAVALLGGGRTLRALAATGC